MTAYTSDISNSIGLSNSYAFSSDIANVIEALIFDSEIFGAGDINIDISSGLSFASTVAALLEGNNDLTANVAFTDLAAALRAVVNDLTETLEFGGILDSQAIYVVTVTDGVNILAATVGTGVEVDVWVVNAKTGAATRYEQYPMNSFATIGGRVFGTAFDGVYEMAGDDDAGTDIDASVQLGRSNLGAKAKKIVPNIWLSGKMEDTPILLKVVDLDGSEYLYEAKQVTDGGPATALVTTGKGLKMVYWQLEVYNQAGSFFDLDSAELEIVTLDRRAY